jgi:N6-adenosine-specific RNA methylase IME4
MTTELTLYQSASAIRKQLPSIDLQYDYQQKLSALKLYAKDKQFFVAQLEAEVAMAQTLPQAMKLGDVKAERNGKGQPKYVLLLGNNSLNNKTVSDWRKVSAIPARDRSRYYGTEERPTRSGLLRWWDGQTVNAESAVQSHGIVTDLHDLTGKTFGCIYADPPWAYSNKATRASVGGKSKSAYKSTMTVDEICAEPVADLAADESHLHLWTTNAFLFEAKRVMEAWGFEYKSCFIWVKSQMGIGHYWRVSHEFMLLGVRGGLRFRDRGLKSWLECPRKAHSAKPAEVRRIVEKASPGPYLELYGREKPDDKWTVYGNEIQESLF